MVCGLTGKNLASLIVVFFLCVWLLPLMDVVRQDTGGWVAVAQETSGRWPQRNLHFAICFSHSGEDVLLAGKSSLALYSIRVCSKNRHIISQHSVHHFHHPVSPFDSVIILITFSEYYLLFCSVIITFFRKYLGPLVFVWKALWGLRVHLEALSQLMLLSAP